MDTEESQGLAISAIDERLMLSADFIIANLTPIRGIAADVGTAFELGFMCARGCPAYAYSNTTRGHFERTRRYYDDVVHVDMDGQHRGPDGLAIDDFEMIDNLMRMAGSKPATALSSPGTSRRTGCSSISTPSRNASALPRETSSAKKSR